MQSFYTNAFRHAMMQHQQQQQQQENGRIFGWMAAGQQEDMEVPNFPPFPPLPPHHQPKPHFPIHTTDVEGLR